MSSFRLPECGDSILVVGVSGRAAAGSLRRIGATPIVVDLFADADTQADAACYRSEFEKYPEGLFAIAEQLPRLPWMYLGGLENFPKLVAGFSQEREVMGNPPEVLERVRDPFQLDKWTQGLPIQRPRNTLTSQTGWLRKPRAGSGGRGISFTNAQSESTDEGIYYQQFVMGRSLSSVHVSSEKGCQLFGISEQLVGESWAHAEPFAYVGNIGSLKVDWGLRTRIAETGAELAKRTGLMGVWGMDWILNENELTLIEINPRYSASVEVHERAMNRSVFRDAPADEWKGVFGKATYFMPVTIEITDEFDRLLGIDRSRLTFDSSTVPYYADIPNLGEIVECGKPLLTLFERAEKADACRAALKAGCERLDRLLGYS